MVGPVDQPMLEELIKELDAARKSGKLGEALKSKPQLILPFRLALSLSQREFRKHLKNGISQQTLIKYENGKTKQINDKILKMLSEIPVAEIRPDEIVKNHETFKHMQKYGQMTSERGRLLQKLSLNKTSRKERELWGRKGAIIANSKQRLTEQEKSVDKLLKQHNICYEVHKQIDIRGLSLNIDFVVYTPHQEPVVFIEATNRVHDMHIVSQAYAYRSIILKKQHPSAKTIIFISERTPHLAKIILEKEYDYVLTSVDSGTFERILSIFNS